jgi:hypothetical protein
LSGSRATQGDSPCPKGADPSPRGYATLRRQAAGATQQLTASGGNVSQQPVLTQMHHLVEAAQAKFVSILPLNFKGQTNQQRSEIMKRHARDPVLYEYLMQLSSLPHVLIERTLFERIRNDDPFRAGLIRTLQDLKTAGLLHLPYPEMVVQLPRCERSL